MPQNHDAVKVSSAAFKSLLGIDPTEHADPQRQPDNTSFVSRFSKTELRSFLKDVYTAPEIRRPDLTAAGIISYLKPVHKAIGEEILNVDKMKALAPEIEQSRILVSSAIMSPNDLQDGEFHFSFDNIPGVGTDPDLCEEIAEVYNEFYNKTLNLGIKSYDWIGDIQYRTGSKPILILPIATQQAVKEHHEGSANSFMFNFGPGFASFDECFHRHTDDDYFWTKGKKVTWKDVLGTGKDAKKLIADMIPSMEEFNLKIPPQYRSKNQRNKVEDTFDPEYVEGLEAMIVNLRTKLNEGDVIKVSENPEVLRFATQKKLVDKHQVYEKLKKKYTAQPFREEVVELEAHPEGIAHKGHPTIIELPSESVIPIHVPGAATEHLGYFVLLDMYGQPLTIENSGMAKNPMDRSNMYGGCQPGTSHAAYEALFGKGCCASTFFTNNDISSAGNMIFQNLFEKYLKSRMKGIFGRDDLQISRFNAISTTLFYRLLDRKETMVVFVPTTLLHYFAFDYDKNTGVGISKLRDVQFLLSLRTTLMMAQIIGMINDSINHTTVSFSVDDKIANIEGVMDMMANMFIAKSKLNGSIDPSEIMRDMYSNALTIVPKNIPGINSLDIDVDNKSTQSVKPDDQLLETLTNLLVSHLDVPPAALNQISEPEFARSLVTYNLFFAKKISRYQRVYCDHMDQFIHTHSQFDPIFQQAIRKKLEAHGKKKSKERLPAKTLAMAKKNPNKYIKNYEVMLQAILEGVKVSLPSPNIVVDKTQFEEIRNFTSNLNEMADQFFSGDLVPSDDQGASTGLNIAKAMWKREQLMKFLENVGSFNMVEIPDIDELDPTSLIDFIQTMQNLNAALTSQRNAIVGSQDDSSGGFGDSSYGSSDGGFGGGFDDLGGGDMSGEGDAQEMAEDDDLEAQPDDLDMLGGEGPKMSSTVASMYKDIVKK